MCFFFFKKKTAYEMRISDWSSDVCSSDLVVRGRDGDLLTGQRSSAHDPRRRAEAAHRLDAGDGSEQGRHRVESIDAVVDHRADARPIEGPREIGRAS